MILQTVLALTGNSQQNQLNGLIGNDPYVRRGFLFVEEGAGFVKVCIAQPHIPRFLLES